VKGKSVPRRGADNGHRFARRDGERNLVQNGQRLATAVDTLGQIANLNHHCCCLSYHATMLRFPICHSLLLAGLLLLGPAALAARTILVFGDSLSAGYGIRQDASWPALLARRLQEKKLDYSVVNASISGETSAGGRARIGAALNRYSPQVVIVALGANDGLRGLPPKLMAANLQAMIDASRQAGARILLVGMRMPPNYGPDYTASFENAFKDLARNNKIRLVPFMMEGFADKRHFFQQDGIHPVADAQPIILDTIWRELAPLLRR